MFSNYQARCANERDGKIFFSLLINYVIGGEGVFYVIGYVIGGEGVVKLVIYVIIRRGVG
jgi:hypothetical protein